MRLREATLTATDAVKGQVPLGSLPCAFDHHGIVDLLDIVKRIDCQLCCVRWLAGTPDGKRLFALAHLNVQVVTSRFPLPPWQNRIDGSKKKSLFHPLTYTPWNSLHVEQDHGVSSVENAGDSILVIDQGARDGTAHNTPLSSTIVDTCVSAIRC